MEKFFSECDDITNGTNRIEIIHFIYECDISQKPIEAMMLKIKKDNALLTWASISSSNKKQGIGKNITDKIKKYCLENNIAKIKIRAANESSIFWKKQGFCIKYDTPNPIMEFLVTKNSRDKLEETMTKLIKTVNDKIIEETISNKLSLNNSKL